MPSSLAPCGSILRFDEAPGKGVSGWRPRSLKVRCQMSFSCRLAMGVMCFRRDLDGSEGIARGERGGPSRLAETVRGAI
jgi:hypothetical protein